MARILITGMSGTGKSSVVQELARRGEEALDTDTDEWSAWVEHPRADGTLERDWVWREPHIQALLTLERPSTLYVCGCKSNQGAFYPLFDAVVLLSAPAAVLLERVAARSSNPYGKTEAERAEILGHLETVEPLLRAGCTLELDTSRLSISEVADAVQRLAARVRSGA